MAKGKQTCKILKEIRKQIAADNNIDLVIEECTYKGDCLGTCPRCESEVRYLERELEKRQRMGQVAVFAGMSLGTLFASTSCDSTQTMVEKEPLGGEVMTIVPDAPKCDKDTIQDDLMGLVKMYQNSYPFDSVVYEQLMKKRFVFPEMDHLSVVSGEIQYQHTGKGEACTTLEKLIEATEEFRAPYYREGEQKILENLSFYLSDYKKDTKKYDGEMEVAFTVDQLGKTLDIEIQKGLDETLDAEVVSFFEHLKWEPACYELKEEGRSRPFDCRCTMTIQFPISTRLEIMGIPAPLD